MENLEPSQTNPTVRKVFWFMLFVATAIVVASFLVPAWLTYPFRKQSNLDIEISFFLRRWSPLFTPMLFALVLTATTLLWRQSKAWYLKVLLMLALVLSLSSTWLVRQNYYEWAFSPLHFPEYTKIEKVDFLSDKDLVIAVEIAGESVAYPVRQIFYHHIIEDNVGGVPIVVTYCGLCRSGLVWESTLDGRKLSFNLSGIKNQNFIMSDVETGSWWQQATGKALQGPLKGSALKPVLSDIISFGIWKQERPTGRVLVPEKKSKDMGSYENDAAEQAILALPMPTFPQQPLQPRELVAGINIYGLSKAYPVKAVEVKNLIFDILGTTPIVIVIDKDRKSVRSYEAIIDGKQLELSVKSDSTVFQMVDKETGSEWDFSGKAISGSMTGKQLKKIPLLTEYWFNWKEHNPETKIYTD